MSVRTKTPAINNSGIDPRYGKRDSPEQKKANAENLGINGDHMPAPVPKYIESPSDTIIKNRYNSWIILGRDRPSTRASGHGATGDTHAASIDIVAGLMGANAASHDVRTGQEVYCDPDMTNDAARIYISQKTNIDKNFKLIAGKVGNSEHKSGIAIKADAVRIMSRHGMKLVTGVDPVNSQNSDRLSLVGVDIIAGNIDDASKRADLQPMVKGANLAACLRRLSQHVADLNGVVNTFLKIQDKYNKALMHHFHTSPYFTAPTTPSEIVVSEGVECAVNTLIEAENSLRNNKKNLGVWQGIYLKSSGKRYINSRWNKVN